jgi:hypothetical protein
VHLNSPVIPGHQDPVNGKGCSDGSSQRMIRLPRTIRQRKVHTMCPERTHGPKSVHAAQKFPASQIFTAKLHMDHVKVNATSLKSLTSLRVVGETPRGIPISNDATEKNQVCCSNTSHPTFSYQQSRGTTLQFLREERNDGPFTKNSPSPGGQPEQRKAHLLKLSQCSKRTHGPKSVHEAQKFPTSLIITGGG